MNFKETILKINKDENKIYEELESIYHNYDYQIKKVKHQF